MTAPFKVTAVLMPLSTPSTVCRIRGIWFNHTKHAQVEPVRQTVIKAVPIPGWLVALAGIRAHVLNRFLPASAGINRL